MRKLLSVGALLGSLTTIFCCFLPFLFAILGFGAVFAGFVVAVPQITVLSEHKLLLFSIAGILLGGAWVIQIRAERAACPPDQKLAEGCETAKDWARRVLIAAVVFYVLGFVFAFLLPVVWPIIWH